MIQKEVNKKLLKERKHKNIKTLWTNYCWLTGIILSLIYKNKRYFCVIQSIKS